MQHVGDTRRSDECAIATTEALLRAAAQWQPEGPIAEGMLANVLASRTRTRRVTGFRWAWAAVCAPVGAAFLLALVVRSHEPAGGERRAVSPARPIAIGHPVAEVSAAHSNGVVRSRRAESVAARPVSHPGRSTRASGGAMRVGHNRRRAASGRRSSTVAASNPARTRLDTADRVAAWRTYTVPRYVTGVSTGALIRGADTDGNAEYVPAVLHVPLGEICGEPSDDHHFELDVVPIRHIMEEFDE